MLFKIFAEKKILLSNVEKLMFKANLSCKGGLIPSPALFLSPNTSYICFLLPNYCVFDFQNRCNSPNASQGEGHLKGDPILCVFQDAH